MSKCENCIHYDCCLFLKNKLCPHFKDKSPCVEVVRCKDCIHRHKPKRCALWYATVGDIEYFLDRGEDFYCEWGETQEQAERKLKEVRE